MNYDGEFLTFAHKITDESRLFFRLRPSRHFASSPVGEGNGRGLRQTPGSGKLRQVICNKTYQYALSIKSPSSIKLRFMASTSRTKTKLAKKILVVEDEGQTGLALDMVLSDREFELDYVNSLLTAGEYLEKNTPSIVILDN